MSKLEFAARVIRVIAIAWALFTVLTFGLQAGHPSKDFEGAVPLAIGGSVLSFIFAAILVWPGWIAGDVRGAMPRILMVLRWQLTTGAIVAFTVAAMVRRDLSTPFGVYGVYLVIGASVLYIPLALIDLALSKHYAAADEARRRQEATTIAQDAAQAAVKSLSLWQLLRRSK